MSAASKYPAEPILLVDDEPAWLNSLAFTLEYSGHVTNLLTCSDSRELSGMLRCQPVSLVLLDLVMPHIGGEDLLLQIVRDHPGLPVIVLSGLNQLETAVRCMKLGAFDYFVKTTDPERLLSGIQKALELQALQRENRELTVRLLQRELQHPEVFAPFATRSQKMEAVCQYLEAIAGSSEPLLIVGEPATGKELAARALHALACPDGPWVMTTAAELSESSGAGEDLGSGLLARARGGVLYVEEIGRLSLAAQDELARWLQGGDEPAYGWQNAGGEARLVCSSSDDLPAMVNGGLFRKDLFFRLSLHQIRMLPLRERLEDLPLLLDQCIAETCAALKRRKPVLPRNLVPLLASHAFPGNLRELRELVAGVVAQSPVGRLSMELFHRYLDRFAAAPPSAARDDLPLVVIPGRMPTLAEARDLVIQEALRRANDNQSIAARLLGISQPALSIHLKKK
jgi:DNA-binding NtrC family response regulator